MVDAEDRDSDNEDMGDNMYGIDDGNNALAFYCNQQKSIGVLDSMGSSIL